MAERPATQSTVAACESAHGSSPATCLLPSQVLFEWPRPRDDTIGHSRLNRHGVAVLVPFHVAVARGFRTEASTEGFSNDYVYCSIL